MNEDPLGVASPQLEAAPESAEETQYRWAETTEILPPPIPRRPRRRLGWLWPLLVVLLVGAVGFLWLQNRAAAAAVDALTTRLPSLLLPGTTDNPLAAQLDLIRQDTDSWNFRGAQTRSEALALPPGLRSPMPEGGPAAAAPAEVSPQANAFLEQHPDLKQRFTTYAEAARALRDQGKPVDNLRVLRDQILQAADQGDVAQVTALLDQFAAALQAPGAGPPGDEMQSIITQFQAAFAQAQREGRDPRPAAALIRQAEAANQSGDRAGAIQLARRALEALRKAPRLAGSPGPGPRPLGSQVAAAANRAGQVLRLTFMLMQAEDSDLATAAGALEETLRADREQNQDQVAEIVSQAQRSLENIRVRRVAFGRQLSAEQAPPPPGEGQGQPPAGAEPTPAPESGGVMGRLVTLLDRVRELPVEQYRQAREAIVRDMVGLLLNSGPPAPTATAGQPQTAAQAQAAVEAESRVRAKLRLGWAQAKAAQGQDATEAGGLLRTARSELLAGRLALAEALTDEALRKLGLLPPAPGAGAPAGPAPPPALAPAGPALAPSP